MRKDNEVASRDEVLFAFHRTCEHPTAEQIIEWTERYPHLADDIRAHAAVALDWARSPEDDIQKLDGALLSRSRSRALNAIYNAQRAAEDKGSGELTLQQMMSDAGLSVPHLARQIDIERSVLADLTAGRMRLPIGRRLVEALTAALGVTSDALERAVAPLLSNPRLGMAKADREPTVFARSYEEIIRGSSMSEERKQYWLGGD